MTLGKDRYYVKYKSKDGDYILKRIIARNCNDAIRQIQEEYNVEKILQVGLVGNLSRVKKGKLE